MADLLIHQIFFCQMLKTSQFANISPYQSFPLYGIYMYLAVQMHYRSLENFRLGLFHC